MDQQSSRDAFKVKIDQGQSERQRLDIKISINDAI